MRGWSKLALSNKHRGTCMRDRGKSAYEILEELIVERDMVSAPVDEDWEDEDEDAVDEVIWELPL